MNAEVCTICQDNIHADEAVSYLHMNSANGHHAFHKNCAAQCFLCDVPSSCGHATF